MLPTNSLDIFHLSQKTSYGCSRATGEPIGIALKLNTHVGKCQFIPDMTDCIVPPDEPEGLLYIQFDVRFDPVSIAARLSGRRRVLLSGAPGSGKSTLAARLATVFAERG